MTLHKVLKYLALVIGVIGLIFLGRIVFTGDDAIKDSADLQASLVDPFIYLGYVILGIVLLFVIVFVVKGLFAGNIKNTLISVAAFVVVLAVAYFASSGEVVTLKDGGTLSASGDRWVGTGLTMFYILAVIAIGSMVASGIKKLINN